MGSSSRWFFVIVFLLVLPFQTGCPPTASTPSPMASPSPTPSPSYTSNPRMFVTASTFLSPFGGSAAAALAAADSGCMSDANKPSGGGTYKALVASSLRSACTTANCSGGATENISWILRANTTYYRSDGVTVIGTTNSAGIFPFPLANSISTAMDPYMTGLLTDWTTAADNCADWISGNAGLGFRTGYTAGTSAAAIDMGAGSVTPCDQSSYLVCVEQ